MVYSYGGIGILSSNKKGKTMKTRKNTDESQNNMWANYSIYMKLKNRQQQPKKVGGFD